LDKKKLELRKAEKAMASMAALMQQIKGDDTAPVVRNFDVKEAAKEAVARKVLDKSNAAEGVLTFLSDPRTVVLKYCKRCEEPFGTNYQSVAYCSDNCRAKALEKIGIQWNPHKRPEERWGGQPPLVIPPEAIDAMVKLLRKGRAHHREAAAEIVDAQNQTEIHDEAGGLVTPSDESQERVVLPIEAEALAAASSQVEPVVSDAEPVSQSESNPEYNRPEDVPTQEDSPATTSPQELPESQPELKKPARASVFGF